MYQAPPCNLSTCRSCNVNQPPCDIQPPCNQPGIPQMPCNMQPPCNQPGIPQMPCMQPYPQPPYDRNSACFAGHSFDEDGCHIDTRSFERHHCSTTTDGGCGECQPVCRRNWKNHDTRDCEWKMSDYEILSYLLKKYRLDRRKIEATIIKNRIKESQYELVEEFYKAFPELIGNQRPIDEHYRIFCRWNQTNRHVAMDVLEDYVHEQLS
jgi:hypothetical protein